MTTKAATGLLSGALLTACLSWKTQPGFAAACLAVGVMLACALYFHSKEARHGR